MPIVGLMSAADFGADFGMMEDQFTSQYAAASTTTTTDHVTVPRPGSPVVIKGRVLPPKSLSWLVGSELGIACSSDNGCLESVVLVLFAFHSHFDNWLYAAPDRNGGNALPDSVRAVLVDLVNPVRRNSSVGSDKVGLFVDRFRSLIGTDVRQLGPDQLVTVILHDLLHVPVFYRTFGPDSFDSYVYPVDTSSTRLPLLTLQHLLDSSVIRNPAAHLDSFPRPVFVVSVPLPDLGSVTRVFPSPILNLSRIVQNQQPSSGSSIPECRDCGTSGFSGNHLLQCPECSYAESGPDRPSNFVFCHTCSDRRHQLPERRNHRPINYGVGDDGDVSTTYELYALVSLSVVERRYTAFVRIGRDWIECRQSPINGRPSVEQCPPEFNDYLATDVESRMRGRDDRLPDCLDRLPDCLDRLATGLRLCFYQPSST